MRLEKIVKRGYFLNKEREGGIMSEDIFFKYSLAKVIKGKEGRHLFDGIISLRRAKNLLAQFGYISHLHILRYTYSAEDWSLVKLEYLDDGKWKEIKGWLKRPEIKGGKNERNGLQT